MTFHANFFRKMALGAVCACAGISCADDALLATFRQPPPGARPEVWWHWMNGNVSRAGIVADLDAMAAVGLGGVILDLGDVKNLATVTVNGRTYPPLWRPPFRVDVTDAWANGAPRDATPSPPGGTGRRTSRSCPQASSAPSASSRSRSNTRRRHFGGT